MGRLAPLIVAVVALVIAIVILGLLSRDHLPMVNAPTARYVPMSAEPAPVSRPAEVPIRPLAARAASEGAGPASVLVVNEAGQPLLGAMLVQYLRTARTLKLDKDHVIGITDERGLASIDPPAQSEDQLLAAGGKGYATKPIEWLRRGEERTIVLERMGEEAFTFTTHAKTPVQGVRVSLSQVAMDVETQQQQEDGLSLPAPAARYAVYAAASDASGRAIIQGLRPGRYGCTIYRAGMYPDMATPFIEMDVPSGKVHEIRMCDLYGVVVKAGADVVDDYIVPDIAGTHNSSNANSFVFKVRSDLIQKWPDCVVVVYAPASESALPRELSVTAFLSSGRRVILRDTSRPIASIDAPTEVTPLPAEVWYDVGSVLVTVRARDGRPQPDVPCVMDGGPGRMKFKVLSGRRKVLPVGHYAVVPRRPLGKDSPKRQEVDVAAGVVASVDFPNSEVSRRCVLAVRTREGVSIGSGGVTVTAEGVDTINYGGALPAVFYLPVGTKANARVYAFGVEECSTDFEVRGVGTDADPLYLTAVVK